MEIYTHYNRPKKKLESGGGPTLVDVAGYIPAKKRIENLMMAGQRLLASRREMYDFPDGEIDEDAYDITRSKNFDMADAFQLQEQLKERQKSRQKPPENASQNAVKLSGEVLKSEKASE